MIRARHWLMGAASVPLALGAAGTVTADTRAVYETPDGEFVVEYRDADNLRLAVPGEEQQFLVISDGDGYVLGRDDQGWYAIDVEQLAELAADEDSAAPDVRVEATGEERMVAGIVGQVYDLEEGDSWADDWQKVDQVVLSDDSRLSGIGTAFQRVAEVFEGMEQDVEMVGVGQVDTADYALLRSSDMEMTSFSSDTLPDQNFQLPPDVRHRDLMAEAEEAAEGDAPEEEGDDEPGWLSRQIRGTGEDARDDAADETRGETRDRVRDGVRSLFD